MGRFLFFALCALITFVLVELMVAFAVFSLLFAPRPYDPILLFEFCFLSFFWAVFVYGTVVSWPDAAKGVLDSIGDLMYFLRDPFALESRRLRAQTFRDLGAMQAEKSSSQ